jgi:D-aminopeptidase
LLDGDVRARLPRLEQAAPGALHLCHNQSGLRDYWAVAMLHGSPVEAPFGEIEAAQVIGATRTLQFAPGSRGSYVNQNFRLLADILRERNRPRFRRIVARPHLRSGGHGQRVPGRGHPRDAGRLGGVRGHTGHRVPCRRERHRVDRRCWAGGRPRRHDRVGAVHRRDTRRRGWAVSPPVGPGELSGWKGGRVWVWAEPFDRVRRAVTGHGGALRGWRSSRLYVPAERVSVVVMFNHMANAHDAAMDLLGALLGEAGPRPDATIPTPAWLGAYIEPETGLAVRIEAAAAGQVRLRYGHYGEELDLRADGSADSDDGTRLRLGEGGLWMDRPRENASSCLRRLESVCAADVVGRYRCEELDAALTVTDAGGVLYGGFSGFLGQGRMEMLEPVGTDVWALPCPGGWITRRRGIGRWRFSGKGQRLREWRLGVGWRGAGVFARPLTAERRAAQAISAFPMARPARWRGRSSRRGAVCRRRPGVPR